MLASGELAPYNYSILEPEVFRNSLFSLCEKLFKAADSFSTPPNKILNGNPIEELLRLKLASGSAPPPSWGQPLRHLLLQPLK